MFLGITLLFIGQIFANTVMPIGTKLSVPFLGALPFLSFRFLITLLLLFPIFLFSKRKKLKIKDYRDFFILGLSLATNVILFSLGIVGTTVIMSTLLYSLTPIIVGIAGHFFLHEKLDTEKVIGLCLAFLGVLFLLSQSLMTSQHAAFGGFWGNMLIFIAVFTYSFYIFYSRKTLHTNDHHPIQTTFFTMLFSGIIIGTVLLLGFFSHTISLKPFVFSGSVGAVLVGAASVVHFLFLQVGIKRTTAFTASLFQYFGPFIAASVTIPFLGEKVTPQLIIGGMCILSGVFVATTYEQMKKMSKRKR